MFTVLAGGVGAARFLRGLTSIVDAAEVTAVVNVGDDLDHLGLRVCPDLDTITYWLAGIVHPDQQWGRADESFTVAAELERFGHERWFTIGDRDLALHLHRTMRLEQGWPLSAVTAESARAFGVTSSLLPVTDDRVETRIDTRDGRDLGFQEYWVRERGTPEVAGVRFVGAEDARPAPGVVEAILHADAVLLAPSNPVVSIGAILAVPGLRDALAETSAPVVGVSPIVGGRVVRGMAHRLLPTLGVEVTADAVARHYRPLIDAWVIDSADVALADALVDEGLPTRAVNTMMDDPRVAADLAATCLSLADHVGQRPRDATD